MSWHHSERWFEAAGGESFQHARDIACTVCGAPAGQPCGPRPSSCPFAPPRPAPAVREAMGRLEEEAQRVVDQYVEGMQEAFENWRRWESLAHMTAGYGAT